MIGNVRVSQITWQISTCSGFAAIHLANLKKMRGLHATGVAGVACARHEMWRPNGLGDLQKGERYEIKTYIIIHQLYFTQVLKVTAMGFRYENRVGQGDLFN